METNEGQNTLPENESATPATPVNATSADATQPETTPETVNETVTETVNNTVTETVNETVAETGDEQHDEPHDELHPAEDLSGLSKTQLLHKLAEVTAGDETESIRGIVKQLKDTFREIVREEMEARRRAWEATREGENDTFEPAPDHEAERFEELIRNYNRNRAEQRRKKDLDQVRNLQQKLLLIEELKTLAESSDSMQKAFEKVQDIQNRWRTIGPVPQAQAQELWQNWQHHQNRFFDVVKISRELRELDMKKNQELKEEIIAKAKELSAEASVRRAIDRLHQLHENWREIGPAPKEINDTLWERFKAASDVIHSRREAMMLDVRKEQDANLKLKLELCDKMDAEAAKDYDSHKAWQDANAAVEALFAEWRKIGFVPKADEDRTWKHFREARQTFFRNRESFYMKQREAFKGSLNEKIRLCEEAEKLSTSTDWKNTANSYKRLLDDWKKVGPIPRKQADKLWARFKAASDAFFNARNNQFAAADAELKANVTTREAIIQEAAATELPDDIAEARKVLTDLQNRWQQMPGVPRDDRNRLDNSWKDAIDALYNKLREKSGGDDTSLQRMRYEQLQQTEKGRDQIYRERAAILEKIKRIEHEINTLETNLGFFGKSKGATSLVADYQKKADAAKEEVKRLKAQLKQIPRD
ncbi:MAG: DUF349 domain-containing protein [Bacteroidia bacterium]